MLQNWKSKSSWEVIQNEKGENVYLFRLQGATPEERAVFDKQISECQLKGKIGPSERSFHSIKKGDLIFSLSDEAAKGLDGIWKPQYSELCDNLGMRSCWDKIFIATGRVVREGYRINISLAKEFEIKRAKEILSDADVVFEDRKATSYSDTVQPGDRTLRVIHQRSVCNLRRFWTDKVERSRLAQSLREKYGR